ncbi:DCN1-like protein 5 [Coemansia sp. RSA 1200]|nr:DCN1-like protein 5 [Coemansia sp. RSA 1200]
MSARKLKIWFNQYKDPDTSRGEEKITPEGYQKLCESLGYSMEGIEALVLTWKLGSKDMGTITYQNWESGLRQMGVSDAKELKQNIDYTVAGFSSDVTSYRSFYRSVFNFLKLESQRTADVEDVKAVLPVVVGGDSWVVPRFIEFLDESGDKIKSITRDQWQLFPNLVEFLCTTDAVAGYNTDDSWPKLYDDFVTWVKSRS